MVFEPPLDTITGLLLLPLTVSVIDWTGQVMKLTGTLFTLLMLAKMEVIPGVTAVACIWPGNNPLTGLLRVTALGMATVVFRVCQVKVPTVAVMSVPRLKAEA
jgi:hypothetical protein